jgi:3-methylcrotonyl-CoA carboxylase beta subunit
MGPEQAVTTLTEVRIASMRREQARDPTSDEIKEIVADVGDYFDRTSGPHHITSEVRDDGLIDMLDTRNCLGMALSASLNAPIVRAPGGILRI